MSSGLIFVSLVLLVYGASHRTIIPTQTSGPALEFHLVKAFANGGLHYTKPNALPDLSVLRDPARAAEAFGRLQDRDRKSDKIKYRVDLAAKTPCPT